MPRKRPVEERLAEAEEKVDRIRLEKAIKDMRIKMRQGRARRRTRAGRRI